MILILKFYISNTKKILPILFALLFFSVLQAQDIYQKDSLLKELHSLKYKTPTQKESIEYVNLLNELSALYRFRDPDSLNIISKIALDISKKIDYEKGMVVSKIRQGDYFSDTSKPKTAEKIYEELKTLQFVNSHPEIMIDVLKSCSFNHFFRDKLKEGINHIYRAIVIAKENKFYKIEARLRHNLGYFYWSRELFEEAQQEYMVADSLWNVAGDTINLALTKSNIALNSLGLNKLEKAEKYINQSIDVISKGSNSLWLSRNYRVKSSYFIASKDFKNALIFNKKSDSVLDFLFNPRDKLQILENYAEIFYKNGSLDQLQEYNLKLYNLADELKNTKAIREAYYYSKEVEFQKGNFKQTVTYQRILDSLDGKLEEHRRTNNLKFLRAKLEYDKGQIELRAENERKLARQTNANRITIIALIISLLIGCLIIKYYYNQKKVNKELKEINDTKDKIFSIIGHDLKTPLNTLKELLELFKDKAISPKEMIALTPRIQNNVDYGTFTLNNLLYWAQSQMDGIRADPSKINITKIVADTVLVFSNEALKKNIQIRNRITAEDMVYFDCEHLRIIFRNLISNAIKFTPDNGEIEICSDSTSLHTTIKICDAGIGIDENTYSKLFNQDKMYSTKGTNNEKGTGLGLSICKELLQKNNSLLKIEPNSPNGSCFIITIPKT